MNFDEPIDRRGTDCAKWGLMESVHGVPQADGLAMWVADMDFRPPQAVRRALQALVDHGVFGYPGSDAAFHEAIAWWMRERHGWEIDEDTIFTTHGLVNGVALAIDAYTSPGDGVVLFTPVYHAFARVIAAAGRRAVECPMPVENGRYRLDFEAFDAVMSGGERMAILCSPHNPGGRVWSAEELSGIAAFCRRHDLICLSDEIHHDLVFPGARHLPMAVACPEIAPRLVMMTAASKTFNIAGAHVGNVIISDPELRARFAGRMKAMGISPNLFGRQMAAAAYSEEGAAWADELVAYLDGNRRLFDAGIAEIPGLASMPLEATYLAWVDFSATGMARDEFAGRVESVARIAVNRGASFGAGGENFLRFNFGTQRARVEEAVERLQSAFSDLQ